MAKNIDSINRDSKTFCAMPWLHQNASLPNQYRPCCNSYVGYNLTTKDASLKEAFHGREATKLRQQLNAGERPAICNTCWDKEDIGVESYRQSFTEQLKHLLDDNKPVLKYIDVEFDNKCNLQCRMCTPHNSDQIWKTVDAMKEKKLKVPNWAGVHERYKYDRLEKQQHIKEVLSTIEVWKITGGEPFLSKDFLECVDFAIENNYAKNIILMVTTNGTKFSKIILEKLKHFKEFKLNISVDGLGEVYDYIRYPYSWTHFEKRINELKNYSFDVDFTCVVQAYNWLNLDQVVLWNDNILKSFGGIWNDIHFNLVVYPPHIEISAEFLPDHILDLGLERLKATEHYQIEDFENFVAYHKANRINPNQLERKRDDLYETTINFDIVRNQSYKTLDPVLVKWLDSLKI